MPEPSAALSVTRDFQVTWRDPADAGLSWLLDDAHYDRPMPLMAQEAFAAIMARAGRRTMFLHGYAFACNRGPTMPSPELEGRDVFQVWNEEYRPRVKAGCAELREQDWDALSTPALARELPELFQKAAELHFLTMSVVQPFLAPTMALLEFCEAHLQEDAGGLAAAVLQNLNNETSVAALELSRLADFARPYPALRETLQTGDRTAIESAEGGSEFLRHLDAFLDAYGWRAERWSALHIPTWAESPVVPLRLIARFAETPAHSPQEALKPDNQVAAKARIDIEARLSPEAKTEFRALVERAAAHVPMSEERTFYQLVIWGSLRPSVLALGKRLAEARAIETANDVCYLTTEEARAAADDPACDYREVVEQRKQALRESQALTPPLHVGAPASARVLSPSQKLFVRHFRGPDERLHQEGHTLKGLAASRGVHHGKARVIADLSDASRLEPGDVLVCGTTSAPWTPLFAIAGAVVTDAGGILAHSAICAREFGIPCVTGTSTGTRLIPDGATVTVDGTQGTVVIESA